jgi:hypothetical protein
MEKKESKKKFNLDKDMIQIKHNEVEPIVTAPAITHKPKQPTHSSRKVHLTLSVPAEFIPEFKMWCINHNTTMSNAVLESLTLLKQKHGY